MTDQIVRDVLSEYDVDPADFAYGEGEGYECPSCPRVTKSSQGLAKHHSRVHEFTPRAGVCGGVEQYREILEYLHSEYELAPTAIANALPDTVGARAIRSDCKDFGIYQPRPMSQSDSVASTLEKMTVEEFDAAMEGAQ